MEFLLPSLLPVQGRNRFSWGPLPYPLSLLLAGPSSTPPPQSRQQAGWAGSARAARGPHTWLFFWAGGGVHLPSQVQEARKQVSSFFDQNELSAAEAGCVPDSGGNSGARLFYSRAAPWCFSGLSVQESEHGPRMDSEDVGGCAEGCAHADSWASHPYCL